MLHAIAPWSGFVNIMRCFVLIEFSISNLMMNSVRNASASEYSKSKLTVEIANGVE